MIPKLSREVRWFLLGVAGVSLVAVLITVIVVATSNRQTPFSQPERVNLAGSLSSLDISDFRIPSSYTEVWKPRFYPSRARETKWSWPEVQRFWLDPRKSLLASITEENNRKMQELFKGVK